MDYSEQISHVHGNIYISGILPLFDPVNITKLCIKLIICCHENADEIAELHDELIRQIPNLSIVYLPYQDTATENLFKNINYNVITTRNYIIDKYLTTSVTLADLAVEIINKEKSSTLIHCTTGKSRSAAIAIYYLMRSLACSYSEAFIHLEKSRPIIRPNTAFVDQLSRKIMYTIYRDYDVEINKICDKLYISGTSPLSDIEYVKSKNIKLIVCCLDKSDVSYLHDKIMKHIPDMKILYLPYEDRETQSLTDSAESASANFDLPLADNLADLATAAINNSNCNTLIHCYAGISRSASIAIYYLMSIGHSYTDSFKMVKNARSIIDPNDGFVEQLQSIESSKYFTDVVD